MDEVKVVVASEAKLASGESVSNFVLGYLLEGKLIVQVTINGEVYDGYVHRLDFAKGMIGMFANVWVEGPGDEFPLSIKVAINKLDGMVTILPPGDV